MKPLTDGSERKVNRDGQPGAAPAAIGARHGVPAEKVRPMASGVANRAYLLGPDLVLRIPRTQAFAADLVKEAAVIPRARRAGVRTPALVTFDDSRTEVDVPYMVLERVPGVDLAALGDAPDGVFREVGRELARLHRVTPGGAGEPAGVPVEYDPEAGAPHRLVDGLLADGMLDAEAARWLRGWFDRLAGRIPQGAARVLVHGDIAPQNVMVSPGAGASPGARAGAGPVLLTGIVDWGDAMWADPAVEFAKTPLSGVPALLDGYREGGDTYDVSYAWEARILRHHLTWALSRLRDPAPVPGERHWTAPPASRLLGILRFFASSPPEPWRGLA